MEDVTRKRILRMLEALPEAQLYQVLDYIEFLEAKYAREAGRKPDAFQRFAERVEDQMRVRSVAPRAMKGTMRLMSTAGRVLDGVRELGQDLAGGAGKRPSNGGGGGAAPEPGSPEPGSPEAGAGEEGDASRTGGEGA